jgi:uncharacterized protein (DUF58 family)
MSEVVLPDGAIPYDVLFDADFLESVRHLRFVARRVDRRGRFAEQRSKDLGDGIEFRDFRPYAAGDDFRAIDWNIYRRLGKVFLRLFEQLEDLPLYLVPDVSASAFHAHEGETPRALAGLRASLALAAISLNQHDSVGLLPFAEDLSVVQRPRAGKRTLIRFAQRLAALEPGGRTDLVASLRRLGALRLRRGVVAIVSDFFDPAGIDALTTALRRVRHRLVLVQLVRKTDRDPDLAGDLRLRDCETGAAENVSITRDVLDRYRAAYDRFDHGLTEFARRHGAGLVRLDCDEDVVPQLAELFTAGSLDA